MEGIEIMGLAAAALPQEFLYHKFIRLENYNKQ